MKRLDLVFSAMKTLSRKSGVTTKEISNYLSLDRSNVSKDLNLLVKDGKLYKSNTRPVCYFLNSTSIDLSNKSELDKLAYLYPSLIPSVKLAKTAILYPPNGLNSLIIGNTGVGKSMLASLMHEYANSLNENVTIPFIHFNCSDYSNNPQLLSAHLFGVKKGTFTGATEDRSGLIEQANNGILFLDEIHNLPKEGQEMLFMFMDTGFFRRFGEVSKKIKSSARIICATNKDIDKSLLDTFLRRIPITIQLPDLNERLVEERLTLIEFFLKQESLKLNMPIWVSFNSMLCLLSYDCPYNIGQLKNDITLAVANAYSEYFINNKRQLKINSPDLPQNLKKHFISSPLTKKRDLLNSLERFDGYFIYDEYTFITSHSFIKKKYFLVNCFKNLMIDLDNLASNNNLSKDAIHKLVNNYFIAIQNNSTNHNFNFSSNVFDSLVCYLKHLTKKLDVIFNDDVFKNVFNIHIDMIYDRINIMTFNNSSILNKLNSQFPECYDLAIKVSDVLENCLNINLAISEKVFLVVLAIYISISLNDL